MLGIGVPANDFHVSPDAFGGTVAALLGIGRSAVYLLELCVIHVHTERAFNGFQIGFVAVCRDLDAATDATGAIFHEIVRPTRVTSAYEVGDA